VAGDGKGSLGVVGVIDIYEIQPLDTPQGIRVAGKGLRQAPKAYFPYFRIF
jgi:hypothetical protein